MLTDALAGLAADVATAIGAPWGVRDQVAGAWVLRTAGFVPFEPDSEFATEGLLVAFSGSRTVVDPAGADPVAVVLVVADLVQTLVMDELGRGWPEVVQNDGSVGLLELRNVGGRPGWAIGPRVMFALGHLPVL